MIFFQVKLFDLIYAPLLNSLSKDLFWERSKILFDICLIKKSIVEVNFLLFIKKPHLRSILAPGAPKSRQITGNE